MITDLHRRHLNASQKAVLAVKLLPEFEKEARARQAHGKTAPGRTLVEKIPEALNGKARERAASVFDGKRAVWHH